MNRKLHASNLWIQIELSEVCNFSCSMCLAGEKSYELSLKTPHMIYELNNNGLMKEIEVEFVHITQNAKRVWVLGEFNYWGLLKAGEIMAPKIQGFLMEKKGENSFYKKLRLRPGPYKFAYMVEKQDGTFNWELSRFHDKALDPFDQMSVSFLECGIAKQLPVRGFMEVKLLKKILNDIKKSCMKFNELAPFWFGESLLHPEFPGIMHLIGNFEEETGLFNIMGLHTNASLLYGENASSLISAFKVFKGISKIVFSLDAARKVTYEKIRKHGNFSKVIENVKNFIVKLKKANLLNNTNQRVLPVVQFIILKENLAEIYEFIKYFADFFKRLHIPVSLYGDFSFLTENPEGAVIFLRAVDSSIDSRKANSNLHEQVLINLMNDKRKIEKLKKSKLVFKLNNYFETNGFISKTDPGTNACIAPFRSMFIARNGEVTVCCADTLMNLKIGQVRESSLNEIWYSKKANNLRKAHLSREYSNALRCLFCPQWEMGKVTPEEIRRFGFNV